MVKLKTEVDLPVSSVKLSYRHPSMMMGSCFTENMGVRLQEALFPVEINPFGILYNPFSIANGLDILMAEKTFREKDIFFANGVWNSFFHHSRFSNPDKEQCLKNINQKIEEAAERLRSSNLLFVTFGTSWVFEDIRTREIVSNCHKLPSVIFRRYRLTPSQIRERWVGLINNLLIVNPSLVLVFTVSPIRHLKDGLHENQLSKSSLLLAIEELMAGFGKERIIYFPSYELVMDEMRDYRYYSSDMVHLTDVAVEVIREKFSGVFLAAEEEAIIQEIEKLRMALNHRPIHPEEKNYQEFIDNQIEKINQLKLKYPFVNMEVILKQFHLKKEAFNF